MESDALPTDLEPVKQQITEGIEGLRQVIAAQLKTITRHFQFHFFPKLNIMEYYRTYSRLVLFMTIFLLAAELVGIGVKWIDGYNQRREQQQQVPVMEKYDQPASQLGNKKSKERPTNTSTDTLNRKQILKSKSPGKNPSKRDLLLDSLNDEIEEYLSKHSLDTRNK